MKIIVPKAQNPGDKTPIEREVKIPDLSFNIHKFIIVLNQILITLYLYVVLQNLAVRL